MTEEKSKQQARDLLLERADDKLRDTENTSNSRHTRVEACFDSIYLRMLVLAPHAGRLEAAEHPSERVILAGGVAAGLDDETIGEVLELHEAVKELRHRPGTHAVDLPHALALARNIAMQVKG